MLNLSEIEFKLFQDYIKTHYGIYLNKQKKLLLYSRLKSLIHELGLNSFKEYYKILVKDKVGNEVKKFVDKITTNHTFFMREKEHFKYFEETVLPYLEKKYIQNKDLRVWCAGCSSGEEAYTLQIIMKEYFKNKIGWNTQLLATDISNRVLNIAYKGIYSKEATKVLSNFWLKKYFENYDENNLIVKDFIKKDIVYKRFNFIEDEFKFKKNFQVIFCRNVMIYFDSLTRETLVNKFYSITEKGGYFFIGHSESLSNIKTEYKYIVSSIYKKL